MTTGPEVPPLSAEEITDDFREQLAALCHEQWSGWMRYLFGRLTHGGLSMMDTGPARAIESPDLERWQRQAVTPYAQLTEGERDSDRREADKFIVLIGATLAAKDAALADVLSMSTCTKCGLRAVPTTYPVGGGPEPLKLVYRCPNEHCGYCVPPPMSAKIESLESQLRDANRRAFDLNNELGATQNAAQAERVELEARVREADKRLQR